jgi:hypothetical protein
MGLRSAVVLAVSEATADDETKDSGDEHQVEGPQLCHKVGSHRSHQLEVSDRSPKIDDQP